MLKKVILHKNPDIVTRVIADETMLMPVYKTSDEINCIYTLNKVASRVWEMIDGKRALSEIKKQALAEFDASEEEVDEEMAKLLKDLKEIKAIV